MTKPELVKGAALERIGCPYVYGGTGKVCTPSYREARMAQYPAYADKIKANCPRLKGNATTCDGCQWADPETGTGKLCYDCAQFALACMKVAGIPLVSGANSQWLKTQFAEKGEIRNIPTNKVCLVFRQDADAKMHHVGVYLGDGTVVHARGHAFGVVRQFLADTEFTHYGVPSGLYDNGLPTLRRGNSGEYVRLMQEALNETGATLKADGKFGALTEQAVKAFQTAQGLKADGVCGPKTWEKLKPFLPDEPDEPVMDEPDVPDWVDEPAVDDPDGAVYVEREELTDLLNQIEAMRGQLDGLAYTVRVWMGADE